MNPIDPTRVSHTAARFDGQVTPPVRSARPARPVASEGGAGVAVDTRSAGLQAPVDNDRVAEIRKAVEQGTYPITPAKIADAMIAAGYLLRHT